MDAEQIHLVRRTFALVERQRQVAALVFYQRLFSADPSLRPMFRTDIEQQAVKLMEILGVAVSLLEQPAVLAAELEQLGARHVGYGVKEEHYATVGAALIGMLSDILGEAFDAPSQAAWLALFGFVRESMLRGAAKFEAAQVTPSR
jgi:hemoglobin-like flavoprotein